MVDYTSAVLCAPVTPFPLIGDVAYHQQAGGGPSHGHRQHAQKKIGKDRACGSTDILADRQTDTQTDILITILRNHLHGRSNHSGSSDFMALYKLVFNFNLYAFS